MEKAIRSEHDRVEQDAKDPYRLLVLNIIGRIDSTKVFNQRLPGSRWTTQDYLVRPFPSFLLDFNPGGNELKYTFIEYFVIRRMPEETIFVLPLDLCPYCSG